MGTHSGCQSKGHSVFPRNKPNLNLVKEHHKEAPIKKVQFCFRCVFNPEVVQELGHAELHLVHGEPLPDALAVAASKRPERERDNVSGVLLQKPLRPELLRLREIFLAVVERPSRKHHPSSFLELDPVNLDVLGAESHVVVDGTVQPQVLQDGGLQVVHLRDGLVVDLAPASFHRFLNLFEDFVLKFYTILTILFPVHMSHHKRHLFS